MSLKSTFVCAASPARRCLPLLLVSAVSSGCIPLSSGEQEDDSRSGFHDVTVRWHIRNLDGSVMASCPPGFTTLVTHLYNAGYVEPPDALVELPCTPEGSLTRPVATAGKLIDEATRDLEVPAYYPYSPMKDIWIDVTEPTQSSYAAVSYQYYVEALTSNTTIEFDLYPEGGVAVAAWSFVSSLTGAPLPSCAAAGVDEIEAAVRPYSDEAAPLVVAGTWPCEQVDPYFHWDPDGNSTLLGDDKLGSGHTRAFAPGDYYVELRARRAGAVVGTAMGAFSSDGKNSAHRITRSEITIDDR
jgi:hypothetical protein